MVKVSLSNPDNASKNVDYIDLELIGEAFSQITDSIVSACSCFLDNNKELIELFTSLQEEPAKPKKQVPHQLQRAKRREQLKAWGLRK